VANLPIDQKIVSKEKKCEIFDIRVHSKGPDDKIFDQYSDIRSKVRIPFVYTLTIQ
jgi:hypothetical protein